MRDLGGGGLQEEVSGSSEVKGRVPEVPGIIQSLCHFRMVGSKHRGQGLKHRCSDCEVKDHPYLMRTSYPVDGKEFPLLIDPPMGSVTGLGYLDISLRSRE